MKPCHASLALTSVLFVACVSQAPELTTPEPSRESEAAEAPQSAGGRTLERTGVFAPAEASALSIWPEAYSGELLVLEVLPHGTIVEEGEVLARLETRTLERQVQAAQLDLRSSSVKHEALLAKNTLADEAAADALAQSQARLDRAQRSLDGYLERELELAKRSKALQARREQGFVDDQVDELDQLQAMYEADELVDATEDIVLKRSRRDLERTRESVAISKERRGLEKELTLPLQIEERQEAVAMQTKAHARLERSQAIEARSRADGALRSASELEKKTLRLEELERDRARLELVAPRAGVLLHGKLDDYRPSGKPARWQRAARLSPRTDVMLVADPAHVAVALDVPEKDLPRLQDGARATISPLSAPGDEHSGQVEIESYPAARGGGVFDARIELGDAPAVMFGMGAKVLIECEPEAQG